MGSQAGLAAWGDPALIRQIIQHLVVNAIDASPDGSAVQLVAVTEQGRVRIDVIDQGSGMTRAFIRDELFKPFVSTKEGGFGLGAFEALQLAQAMGGYSRNGTNRAPRYPGSIASAMVRLGTDWIESFSRAMPTLRQHMILVTNYICMGSAGGPISLALSWGYSHLPVFRHRCCSMNTMSTLCEKQQTHFLSRVMQPIFANALRK